MKVSYLLYLSISLFSFSIVAMDHSNNTRLRSTNDTLYCLFTPECREEVPDKAAIIGGLGTGVVTASTSPLWMPILLNSSSAAAVAGGVTLGLVGIPLMVGGIAYLTAYCWVKSREHAAYSEEEVLEV